MAQVRLMEQRLKQLFDAQKFFKNPKLAALINEATPKPRAIDEDDLGFVAAAGDIFADTETEGKGGNGDAP